MEAQHVNMICMSDSSLLRRLALTGTFLASVLFAQSNASFRISTVSTRPAMVSGDDVLVRVDVPDSVPADQALIKLNGRDITSSFRPDASSHALLGLVTGLKQGENNIEVSSDGRVAATLTVTNHPVTGPIFSGPQEHPFICDTDKFKLPDGTLLGPPLDANCSVKTVVTYVYKTAVSQTGEAGALMPLTDRSTLPADVAWTTTSLGHLDAAALNAAPT